MTLFLSSFLLVHLTYSLYLFDPSVRQTLTWATKNQVIERSLKLTFLIHSLLYILSMAASIKCIKSLFISPKIPDFTGYFPFIFFFLLYFPFHYCSSPDESSCKLIQSNLWLPDLVSRLKKSPWILSLYRNDKHVDHIRPCDGPKQIFPSNVRAVMLILLH